MDDGVLDRRPLTLAELAGHLASGCKPKSEWRVGSEHEKFLFRLGTHDSVGYGPDDQGRGGVQALLEGLTRFGWKGVYEDGPHGHAMIALQRGGASVSLEPAGQFELSGAPLESVHDICDEISQHLTEAKEVAAGLDIGFLGVGFAPTWTRADTQVMPKARYDIMRNYMPKVGTRGLDMMLRTCTVQANLDFGSEADMAAKFRVSLALQPIATALFANSPFVEGKPTGWLSNRARAWTDTDAARTGMLHFVFEDGFDFETYARYALDVPMYFAKRGGRYLDASGQSFRAFIDGELPALPGERANLHDWEDHLSTIFPEVRLKTFLEMRGSDVGPKSRLCGLAAFWIGILYDEASLAAAWELCKDWTREERERVRVEAARVGLKAEVGGRTIRDVALDALALAREGLKRRNRLSSSLTDETGFLSELDEIAGTGVTPAEHWLDLYNGPWRGEVSPIFEAGSY